MISQKGQLKQDNKPVYYSMLGKAIEKDNKCRWIKIWTPNSMYPKKGSCKVKKTNKDKLRVKHQSCALLLYNF